jgi:hypothetical protein
LATDGLASVIILDAFDTVKNVARFGVFVFEVLVLIVFVTSLAGKCRRSYAQTAPQ